MPKQKTLYIRRVYLQICPCCGYGNKNCGDKNQFSEIFSANSYHGKSLKSDFVFCIKCAFTNVRNILKNSPLIFLTYQKNPTLPSFLKRINKNAETNQSR